jgi:hypothetical protein
MSWFCRKSRAKKNWFNQEPLQNFAATKPIIKEQIETSKSDNKIKSIKKSKPKL